MITVDLSDVDKFILTQYAVAVIVILLDKAAEDCIGEVGFVDGDVSRCGDCWGCGGQQTQQKDERQAQADDSLVHFPKLLIVLFFARRSSGKKAHGRNGPCAKNARLSLLPHNFDAQLKAHETEPCIFAN